MQYTYYKGDLQEHIEIPPPDDYPENTYAISTAWTERIVYRCGFGFLSQPLWIPIPNEDIPNDLRVAMMLVDIELPQTNE